MGMKRKLLKINLKLSKTFRLKSYMKIYNRYLLSCGVELSGKVKFIHPSVYLDIGYGKHIHFGDNLVLSVNTIVLVHDYSIECGLASIGKGNNTNEQKIVSDVYIGNNVFIGAGCIILPGTKIGDNCIVGAGTLCSGVIPENSIVCGEKGKVVAHTKEWIANKLNNN